MQFRIRKDGTPELSGSPAELASFDDVVRDPALYGDVRTGILMSAEGVIPIVIVAGEEYEVA